jgi:hypothetical protein
MTLNHKDRRTANRLNEHGRANAITIRGFVGAANDPDPVRSKEGVAEVAIGFACVQP